MKKMNKNFKRDIITEIVVHQRMPLRDLFNYLTQNSENQELEVHNLTLNDLSRPSQHSSINQQVQIQKQQHFESYLSQVYVNFQQDLERIDKENKNNIIKINTGFSIKFGQIYLKYDHQLSYRFIFQHLMGMMNKKTFKGDDKTDYFVLFQIMKNSVQIMFEEIQLYKCKRFLKIAQFIDFPNLKQLRLMRNRIKSIQVLTAMNLPQLKCLILQRNYLTNISALSKIYLKNQHNFNSLFLANNLINDFSQINRWKFPKITNFRVDYYQVNPQDMRQLNQSQSQIYNPQSQSKSFIVKRQFNIEILRFIHEKRIIQQKIQEKLREMNPKLYIGYSRKI